MKFQLPMFGQAAPRRFQVGLLYAVFFVSGFCGLIYESIWSHYLKLLLGHAAYAQAVVLIVFVGGLAVGAWLTGRVSERIRHPVLLYALVEALVAVFAFSFQGIFEAAQAWATQDFLPAMCGEPGPCSASWWLAAALILPPSILLGTTFPLMSAGVIRLGAAPGRGLSLLYFLNSLGAALGVLGSGFVLIPRLGLPGTMLLAGSLNALVALCAYLAVRPFTPAPLPVAPAPAPTADRTAGIPRELLVLLAVAGLTGLSSFIYEVAWIRLLTLVLGGATHSFELMLSSFIFGLAIGAWWIRNRIGSATRPLVLLAKIQLVMGALAVATLPLYVWCFDAMAFALKALYRNDEGYALFNVASAAMAAAVMLPATICAGMTLPLITALLLGKGYGERQVGQVYGVNTLGAILGVLVTVHLLIPAFGLGPALVTGAAIDVALGIVLLGLARRGDARDGATPWSLPRIGLAAAPALAVLIAVPLVAPLEPLRLASGVYRFGIPELSGSNRTVPFHRDGKTATITVFETADGSRALLTNGKSEGQTHPAGKRMSEDDHTTVLLGVMGPAHHPKAKTAAVIGLGTGTTSAVMLEAPALERVDSIEIEPMVVEASQYFRPRNARMHDDPRSRIIIDDARAHFAKVRSTYDIIVSEPSNPWVSGVAGLFTQEFYVSVWRNLAPDGVFVQWLHLYEASPEIAASIVHSFSAVFPEFKAYQSNAYDVLLVARKDGKPVAIDMAAVDAMVGMRPYLLPLGIDSGAALAAHEVGRGNSIRLLANFYAAPPNSDFFPYVDQRGARDRFQKRDATPLFSLRDAPVTIFEFATGAPAYAGQVHDAVPRMPPRVRAMAGGWHGHRFLRGEALAPHEIGYLDQDGRARDYALVRGWIAACAFPAEAAGWDPIVHVASHMNAALDAPTARAFWTELANGPCRSRLSAAQHEWLRLFAAVGAREGRETAKHARTVLAQPVMTIDGRTYATLAAAAAHQSMWQLDEAREVLEAQRAKLPSGAGTAPWFRYLLMALSARERQPADAAAKGVVPVSQPARTP